MRPKDVKLACRLSAELDAFHSNIRLLPGIQKTTRKNSFLEQLVESIHRIQFIEHIRTRRPNKRCVDPGYDLFDPYKAALIHQKRGNTDEAFWLVFLSVHFGKHRSSGWRTLRDVYGRLGQGGLWDWAQTINNMAAFRSWLDTNRSLIASKFGNHRKYESLDAFGPNGTGETVESYVNWVCGAGDHRSLIQNSLIAVGQNPRDVFEFLYGSMKVVRRFGRTGKFDFLTMIGKLGFAPIEPGSTYMVGSTGPVDGAKLLFGTGHTKRELDAFLVDLEAQLGLSFGMQVLEDALCNWQKSPSKFVPFRG